MAKKAQVDKIFDTLSEEQHKIIDEKIIDGRHTANKWLRTLKKLAILDKHVDSYLVHPSYGWKIGIGIAVAIIFFFAAFISEVYYLLILPAIAIGVIYKTVTDRNKIKKLDLSNHFRLFLMPLLSILKEDIHTSARISISAVLKKADQDEYKIKDVPNRNDGYPKIQEKHYKVPRISFNSIFIDNTSLLLTLTDLVRKRDITKRNPRGKIKRKIKYKVKQVGIVKVQFKKSIYQLKAEVPTPENIVMAENENAYVFKAKVSEITTDLEHRMNPNKILKAIGHIYNLVQPIGKEVEGVE